MVCEAATDDSSLPKREYMKVVSRKIGNMDTVHLMFGPTSTLYVLVAGSGMESYMDMRKQKSLIITTSTHIIAAVRLVIIMAYRMATKT